MHFTCAVEIDARREKAVEVFCNREKQKLWQSGLISIEQLEGEPFESGSKARMSFRDGKREFELYETVQENRLPDTFVGEYETPGICWNSMTSRFRELPSGSTQFEAEVVYRLDALPVRLMGWLMPWVFRKQVQKYLDAFRELVENE